MELLPTGGNNSLIHLEDGISLTKVEVKNVQLPPHQNEESSDLIMFSELNDSKFRRPTLMQHIKKLTRPMQSNMTPY